MKVILKRIKKLIKKANTCEVRKTGNIDGRIIDPELLIITTEEEEIRACVMVERITLSKNRPNENSLIATYTIPVEYDMFIFDPNDSFSKILFMPFNEKGVHPKNFVCGDIKIILKRAVNNTDEVIFSGNTGNMFFPEYYKSFRGFYEMRHWIKNFIGEPGDKMMIYFKSEEVFEPKNSVLDVRVRMGKIM